MLKRVLCWSWPWLRVTGRDSQQVWCRALLLLLVVASAWLAPGTRAAQSVRDGIIVATWTDAVSFHPFQTTDTASSHYQNLVFAGGLLERDPHDVERIVGNLAERWEVGTDQVTYTFTLRPDLRWSDGAPLTAFDFQWTYDQVRKPEHAWAYGGNLDAIADYVARDDRTIVVRLRESLAVGLELADAVQPLPRHVWEGLDWTDPARNPEILTPTVGSGPFRLAAWLRGRHAIFVPNDRYFKGRPRLTHYTVIVVDPDESGYQLLREGTVDYASVHPSEYALVRRLNSVTTYEWWPATGSWNYVGFNFRQPLLQDVRVRQALAHAVDRDVLVRHVMYGLAQPIDSTFGPACWCFNPAVPRRDFDLDQARALLDAAGFVPGADGVRLRDGLKLQLRLLYGPLSNGVREEIAEHVRQNLGRIGVEVTVIGLEWEDYLAALRQPPFAWDLHVGGWSGTTEPHWMYQVWSEVGIPALNSGAYRNPRVETLFARGAREFDPAERRAIYGEIQEILAEDQAAIFLFAGASHAAVNNRIGGIRPSPFGIGWNVHEWYVK